MDNLSISQRKRIIEQINISNAKWEDISKAINDLRVSPILSITPVCIVNNNNLSPTTSLVTSFIDRCCISKLSLNDFSAALLTLNSDVLTKLVCELSDPEPTTTTTTPPTSPILMPPPREVEIVITCRVCPMDPVSALVIPCKHKSLCMRCIADYNNCPVCKNEIGLVVNDPPISVQRRRLKRHVTYKED